MAAMPLFSLDGRIALVTGASRGLGLGMAEGLAEAGATVILNGRSADTLEAAAHKLRDRGLKAETAPFDVTDHAAAHAAVEGIIARMGPARHPDRQRRLHTPDAAARMDEAGLGWRHRR